MEASELDEGMKVLDSCLTNVNWRLKPSSKRRLQLGFFSLLSVQFPCFFHRWFWFLSWRGCRYACSDHKNASGCNGRLRRNHAATPTPPLFPPPTRTKGESSSLTFYSHFSLICFYLLFVISCSILLPGIPDFRAYTIDGYSGHDILNTPNRTNALSQFNLQF